MHPEDQSRRITRSQLVQDYLEVSRPQVQSQQIIQPAQNQDMDSGKVKQQKTVHPARKSNWTRKERIRYLVFINYYSQLPYWGSDLKSIPTYKALSLFIKSRSPEQCKSFYLSTRKNYKSIEEMIKSFQEELEQEDGYHRLLDRYEFEVIAFQLEHQLLPQSDLEAKPYFQGKLAQKCKDNGLEGTQNNTNREYLNTVSNNAPSGQSPPQNTNQDDECNLRINIKDYIRENNSAQLKKPTTNEQKLSSKDNDLIHPLAGLEQYPLITKEEMLSRPTIQQSMGYPINNPNNYMMSNPMPGTNYFIPANSFPTLDRNEQAINSETMRPTSQVYQTQRRNDNPANDRMMQQNFNRMIEANKKAYVPFPNYSPYPPSPFTAMNPMHMPPQFRNQMPFNLPPPGGIEYMMHGYNDPYYGINPIPSNRFGPSLVPQHQVNEKRPNKERQNEQINEGNSRQYEQNQTLQKSQLIEYSSARKQLILQSHKHWVNWLRAVTELNRRKQSTRNMTLNTL